MKYLVQYTDDYNRVTRYSALEAPTGSSWRELQIEFDPRYCYSNLRFFPMGDEIVRKGGE